jgi:hypothetical protein
MNMPQIQARITELEARRARGESVPELDFLYKKMDALTQEGYRTATGEGKPKVQKKRSTIHWGLCKLGRQ